MKIVGVLLIFLLSAVCALSYGALKTAISVYVVVYDQTLDCTPVAKASCGLDIAYPREMLRQGVSGIVRARFSVDESGSVSTVVILKPDNKLFDEAVVNAGTKIKFFPETRNGKRASFSVDCDILFDVDDE